MSDQIKLDRYNTENEILVQIFKLLIETWAMANLPKVFKLIYYIVLYCIVLYDIFLNNSNIYIKYHNSKIS